MLYKVVSPPTLLCGVLSLHSARLAGQEVLHVRRHSFGEVGHAAKAATGGAVVQQPTHSCGRVPLQNVLLCTQVHLRMEEGRDRENQFMLVYNREHVFVVFLTFPFVDSICKWVLYIWHSSSPNAKQ